MPCAGAGTHPADATGIAAQKAAARGTQSSRSDSATGHQSGILEDSESRRNELAWAAMAAKRKTPPARTFTDEELVQVARDLVSNSPGVSGNEFKKALASDLKKEEKRVLAAANLLAGRHEFFRWSSARKVRFFLTDPFEGLARAVQNAVAEGPLRESDLLYRVESAHRGYGDLLKVWMKGALTRGELYVHRPLRGTKLKRFGATPDWAELLKKTTAEFKKVLATPAGRSYSPSQILQELAGEVGSPASASLPLTDDGARARLLSELRELGARSKSSGLLSVAELRARVALEKSEFDRVVIELAKEGIVTLHQHDFPSSLSDSERASLVVDSRGNHFIGVALRRTE